MKVLICGGAGYLGGALTDLIPNARVYDSLVYEEAYLKPVDFIRGDIRERKKLKKHLDWADTVVWLAALVGDGACAVNPGLTKELNQDSVKWLSENFDGRIVFMSTCSVYGAMDGILDERSATNPLSAYAVTKLAAEQYLRDKNTIIFRLGTIFGLGDNHSRIRLDLVLNTMTARAISEGKLKVFGGEQYRPLLHVKDAVRAIADNLNTTNTGIYNLHRENMKILDLAKAVQAHVGGKLEIVDTTFEDSRNYKVSSDKARSQLGFAPELSISEGIEEVAYLIRTGRIKDLDNPRYSNAGFLNALYR